MQTLAYIHATKLNICEKCKTVCASFTALSLELFISSQFCKLTLRLLNILIEKEESDFLQNGNSITQAEKVAMKFENLDYIYSKDVEAA